MVKGEDAVRRKKNKTQRKRMRSSESAVSARVAAIIASKRRRKSGNRRICEGMCFTLPTPEDPFNDRRDKINNKKNKIIQKPKPNKTPLPNKTQLGNDLSSDFEDGCLSKFLTLSLNAIQNSSAWKEEQAAATGDGSHLLASSPWGAELWRRCSSGLNIQADPSGGDACASKEQLAWILSTASDIIARREKQGQVVASPFLVFLVPSQQKAHQVRSICKPLKALGIHTVSLHPGSSIDHQIQGLKSCEPEFLVSTPDRLFELVHLQAIDISGVSFLVLDDLKQMVDLGFSDHIESIKRNISGQPQTVIFSGCEEIPPSLLQSLMKEPISRLSLDIHQKVKDT